MGRFQSARNLCNVGWQRRRNRRQRLVCAEHLESRRLLSTVTWTGTAGDGNWDTPGNWSSNPSLPGSMDDVSIPASVTITHSAGNGDTVHSITSGAGDTLNLS